VNPKRRTNMEKLLRAALETEELFTAKRMDGGKQVNPKRRTNMEKLLRAAPERMDGRKEDKKDIGHKTKSKRLIFGVSLCRSCANGVSEPTSSSLVTREKERSFSCWENGLASSKQALWSLPAHLLQNWSLRKQALWSLPAHLLRNWSLRRGNTT